MKGKKEEWTHLKALRIRNINFRGKGNLKPISKQKDRVNCVLSAVRIFNEMNDALGVCCNTWCVGSLRYYIS